MSVKTVERFGRSRETPDWRVVPLYVAGPDEVDDSLLFGQACRCGNHFRSSRTAPLRRPRESHSSSPPYLP